MMTRLLDPRWRADLRADLADLALGAAVWSAASLTVALILWARWPIWLLGVPLFAAGVARMDD